MSHKTLNLGILAHVDAGKTSLTERLLYEAGVIDALGSVDAGTTQTDSLELEQQRGITIKSAVASFPVGEITVNLIDTPGHPDFIAEVERVLRVLDGAVLVVSAVEGVQAQTRILMRTLRRLQIPTLLFVNKIDRPGARVEGVLDEIARRLRVTAIPMGSVEGAGTRDASFVPSAANHGGFTAVLAESLAENDEPTLRAYVQRESGIPYGELRAELAAQTGRGLVCPAFLGSAITGAGIAPLIAGLSELLPAKAGDAAGPVSGSVFKIDRGRSGEKVAYVRMFAGTLAVRDRIRLTPDLDNKVTALAVFERGSVVQRTRVSAGQIGKLWGLADAQIGDRIGEQAQDGLRPEFPPPTLESVVVPRDRADKQRLRLALGQIAEQDPLINVRQDDERQEIYVSLYGEVQKEVIQATLASDFGIAVAFRGTTMICVERPAGRASALELLQSDSHPYPATIGLRVEPAPADSGIDFRLDFDPRAAPIYIYKTLGNFADAMREYVESTFGEGLRGWRVTDCLITMFECGYYVGDGPTKRVLPMTRTTAADFRKLTALVLMAALVRAGTVVCEPMSRVSVEAPATKVGAVMSVLAGLGASVEPPLLEGEVSIAVASLPSAKVHLLQERLPGLTGGEGALETSFGGYLPVHGRFPQRGAPG